MDLAMAVVEKYGKAGLELVKKKRFATAKTFADMIKKNYGTGIRDIIKAYNDYLPWWRPIWDISIGELMSSKELRPRMKCQCGEY